jgi:hypothetical protein
VVVKLHLANVVVHWRARKLPPMAILLNISCSIVTVAASMRGLGALPDTVATSTQQIIDGPPMCIDVAAPFTGRWTVPVILLVLVMRSVNLRLAEGIPQIGPPKMNCSLAIRHP